MNLTLRLLTPLALVSTLAAPALANGAGVPGTGQPAPGAQAATESGDDYQEATWYGYQTLAIDAFGFATFLSADLFDVDALRLGAVTLVLGAPLLHVVHREGTNVFLSLPMRLLLPLAGGAIGGLLDDDYGIEGLVAGMAVASIVDIIWLSRTRPELHRVPATAWAPQLQLSEQGFSAGIGGTF